MIFSCGQDKGLCNLLAKIYNAPAADVLLHSDQNGDVSATAKHFFASWKPQGALSTISIRASIG